MPILILNIIILFLYASFIYFLAPYNKAIQRFLFINIAFLHLLILHIFFDTTSFPDLDNYYDYFKSISNPNIEQPKIEIGWTILNKGLFIISESSFILFFTVSFTTLLFHIITIKRYSQIYWLSIFIFLCSVFYNSLFILRQNLAMAICLMTIPYIIERKKIKFFTITLIAVSFHYSALIWLISFFIYSFKIDKRFYFFLASLSILLFFFMETVLKNLILLTTNIMMYTGQKEMGGLGVLKGLAIDLFVLMLSVYSFGGLNHIKGDNKLFFQLISISVFFTLISYFGSAFTLFGRLNLYFTIPSIFLISNAIANLKNKKIQYILFIPVIFVIYLALLNATAQYGYKLNFN